MLQLVGWIDLELCFCFCLKRATKFHSFASVFLSMKLFPVFKKELVLDLSYFFFLSFCLSWHGSFFSFTEGVSHILAGTLSLFFSLCFSLPFFVNLPLSLSFFIHCRFRDRAEMQAGRILKLIREGEGEMFFSAEKTQTFVFQKQLFLFLFHPKISKISKMIE